MLYVHIPFCEKKCKYCDFNSFALSGEYKRRYLRDLKREMEMYATEEEIDCVFIGGGTPSILNSDEIRELFKYIHENFNIADSAEITMEANPGTLSCDKLEAMKNVGVNRLSMGLQAVQNEHLKYIGRIHKYEAFLKNYNDALDLGFENINVDLMYSLPHQSFEDWKETLEVVCGLNPAHISAYSLILEENTELYEMWTRGEFEPNDDDSDIEMYRYTIGYLATQGYHQYEISNYAKDGYECEHNKGYWKCEHYIAVGPGAAGYIEDIRYNNVCSLDEYHEMVELGKKPIDSKEYLTLKDKLEEKIFMGLRMNEGIYFEDFKRDFGVDFMSKYSNQVSALEERKLIVKDEKGIRLTQKGREISNSVFVEFME